MNWWPPQKFLHMPLNGPRKNAFNRAPHLLRPALYVALSQNVWCPLVYMNWIQSQKSQQECHCWKQQDNPLLFADDLVLLASSQQDLRFNMHLNIFLLRATTPEWQLILKDRYYFSQYVQGSVFCKCTEIHCNRRISSSTVGYGSGNKEIDTRIPQENAILP